jgi:hypothetical protein
MARAIHATDAWLVASGARGHSTDLGGMGSGLRAVQAASAVTQRIEPVIHGVATATILVGVLSQGTGVMVLAPEACVHATSTSVDGEARRAVIEPMTGSGPGFTSAFAFWMGGVAQSFLGGATIHGTSALPVWRFSIAHTTSMLASWVAVPQFATDMDAHGSAARFHGSDSLYFWSRSPGHGADACAYVERSRGHATDVMVAPTALGHTTDVLLDALETVVHSTSYRLPMVGYETHSTDTVPRGTMARFHAVDALVARVTVGFQSHTADTTIRGSRTYAHGTSIRVATPAAYPRSHGTSAERQWTAARVHSTDSRAKRTSALAAGTDSLLTYRAAGFRIHAADALKLRSFIRAHSTSTVIRRTQAVAQATDAQLVVRRTIAGRTDAMILRVVARSHKADSRAKLVSVLIHATDVYFRAAQGRGHSTDTGRLASLWTVSYGDALKQWTATRGHATDVVPCYAYARNHSTGTLTVGSKIRDHVTDALAVQPQTTTHGIDALTQRVPAAAHATDAFKVIPRARIHTTGTLVVHTPPVGRWAAPRVGTRVPYQPGSKERQLGGSSFGIGFLLVSHDRITPILGATATVQLLAPGGGWTPAHGAVVETGNGWYELRPDDVDNAVQGEHILMATAPGAEPAFTKFDVVLPNGYLRAALTTTERNAIADATLIRAFASVAAVPARCLLQAIRVLWTWKTSTSGTMTVFAENGLVAWETSVTTDPTIKPVRGMDPIGP